MTGVKSIPSIRSGPRVGSRLTDFVDLRPKRFYSMDSLLQSVMEDSEERRVGTRASLVAHARYPSGVDSAIG